jgi:hypothetical protein
MALTTYRTFITRKWSGMVIDLYALIMYHSMGMQLPKYCINHSHFPLGSCMFIGRRFLTYYRLVSEAVYYILDRRPLIELSLTFHLFPYTVHWQSEIGVCVHSFKNIKHSLYMDVFPAAIPSIAMTFVHIVTLFSKGEFFELLFFVVKD